MKSGLRDLVRGPGFRPALRTDLRFYRGDTADVVMVHDPVRDRRLQLYEVECLVAREMDGARDLDDITRRARQHMPSATRDQIERLATQIAGMGLLSNVPSELLHRPSAKLAAQQPLVTPPQGPPTLSPPHGPRSSSPPAGPHGLSPTRAGTIPDVPDDPFFEDKTDLVERSPFVNGTPVGPPAIVRSPAGPPAVPPPPLLPESGEVPQPTSDPAALGELAPEEDFQLPEPEPEAEEPEEPEEPEPEPGPPPQEWRVDKASWHTRQGIRRLIYLGGAAAVIAALAFIPYPLYVTEQCVVRPVNRVDVRTQIEGSIAEIFVKEGELVKVGDPIVRLDDRDISYALKQAEAEADRLVANLAKVQGGSRPEEIRRTEALVSARAQDVRFAAIESSRQNKLFRQGVGSASDRDEARRDLQVKRSALAEAQAELRLVRSGSRSEEVAIAEAELRRVQAEVDFLKTRQEHLVLRSPIAGRVLTPRFHERLHERLAVGDFVCEIGNTEVVRVEIFVPESDADVVRVGHPVTVKVKSYPLQAFRGTVAMIAPAVEEVEGQRILRVEAELENSEGLLRPRMSGYAEIDTGKRSILVRIFRRTVRWVRVRFLI